MDRVNHLITPGAAILCAISLTLAGWALWGWFGEARSRRADQAMAWHRVICYSEQAVVGSKRLSPKQKSEAISFYNHILVLTHAAPC